MYHIQIKMKVLSLVNLLLSIVQDNKLLEVHPQIVKF